MADELGPFYSFIFGFGHELQNLRDGETPSELRMDLHNNWQGLNGNPNNLQTGPGSGLTNPPPYVSGPGAGYPI
jgi:hypothetical protein